MTGLPRILLVDDSRMVRMSLARHLKDHYEVREEGDGEAAWQTLVLDQSVRLVISDLSMPVLDGYGLLERLRSSKLRRLNAMPFILVSGEEGETEKEEACTRGVSDFVSKGVGAAEILTRVNNLLELSRVRDTAEEGRSLAVQDPETGLFSRKYLELQAAQALSHATRHQADVSAMVIGFDGYEALSSRLGEGLAEQVANRFAKMLTAKIRAEDSLGRFDAGQFAIISPGTSPALCATFAERVREAVEVARLSAQGQAIALTVSVGVASVPGDAVSSAADLLTLAGTRMRQAMAAGGNRTEAGALHEGVQRPVSLQHALELIAANRPQPVIANLPALARKVMPLLRLIDKELGLALPLAEIERRLSERKNQ